MSDHYYCRVCNYHYDHCTCGIPQKSEIKQDLNIKQNFKSSWGVFITFFTINGESGSFTLQLPEETNVNKKLVLTQSLINHIKEKMKENIITSLQFIWVDVDLSDQKV